MRSGLYLIVFFTLLLGACTKKPEPASIPEHLLQIPMAKTGERSEIKIQFTSNGDCSFGAVDALEMDQSLLKNSLILLTLETAGTVYYRRELSYTNLFEPITMEFTTPSLPVPLVLSLCRDHKASKKCSFQENSSLYESRATVLKSVSAGKEMLNDFLYYQKLFFQISPGTLLTPDKFALKGMYRDSTLRFFLSELKADVSGKGGAFLLQTLKLQMNLGGSEASIMGGVLSLPLTRYDSEKCKL